MCLVERISTFSLIKIERKAFLNKVLPQRNTRAYINQIRNLSLNLQNCGIFLLIYHTKKWPKVPNFLWENCQNSTAKVLYKRIVISDQIYMRRNLLISTRVILEQYWLTQQSHYYSVTSTVYILMPIYLEAISQYGVGGWIGEEEGQTSAL